MLKVVYDWAIGKIQKYLDVDEFDGKKILYFALAFFFIIATSSILRALKTSIFLGIIGKEHLPKAKLLAIILIIPCMMLFSKLVDKLKRHQLVYFLVLLYAVICIIFSIFLIHPTIGLRNTQPSAFRLVGWGFEIFIDFYQALIIGTFWSFINSISTTNFATKSYGAITATSRVGGILGSVLGLTVIGYSGLPGWQSIPLMIAISSICLTIVFVLVFKVKSTIPKEHLLGYSKIQTTVARKKTYGVLEGLKLMLSNPYVFGIFGLVFFHEIVSTIFDYQFQYLLATESQNNITTMSSYMMIYTISFQVIGLLFAILGTISLLRRLGLQFCILLGPSVAFLSVIAFIIYPTLKTVFVIMVAIRAMHYGFNTPIRDMLYIPTIKDIQFKSKGWIDSFGRSFSQSFGSVFNEMSRYVNASVGLILSSSFSLVVIVGWLFTAYFLGKKYTHTVETKQLIGAEEENT
jgi:AAA family ATP:ADP antiporter